MTEENHTKEELRYLNREVNSDHGQPSVLDYQRYSIYSPMDIGPESGREKALFKTYIKFLDEANDIAQNKHPKVVVSSDRWISNKMMRAYPKRENETEKGLYECFQDPEAEIKTSKVIKNWAPYPLTFTSRRVLPWVLGKTSGKSPTVREQNLTPETIYPEPFNPVYRELRTVSGFINERREKKKEPESLTPIGVNILFLLDILKKLAPNNTKYEPLAKDTIIDLYPILEDLAPYLKATYDSPRRTLLAKNIIDEFKPVYKVWVKEYLEATKKPNLFVLMARVFIQK